MIEYLKNLRVPEFFPNSASKFLRNQTLHFLLVGLLGGCLLAWLLGSQRAALGIAILIYAAWEGYQYFGRSDGKAWDALKDTAFVHAGLFAVLPEAVEPSIAITWLTALHGIAGYLRRKEV